MVEEKAILYLLLTRSAQHKKIRNLLALRMGYSTIFTEFSSSKAGVGILFSNNFQFKIQKCLTDPGGRFIIADIETEEKTLTLVNIYAPNNDDPSFFRVVSEKMSSFECDLIVFDGDFNPVCDIQKR